MNTESGIFKRTSAMMAAAGIAAVVAGSAPPQIAAKPADSARLDAAQIGLLRERAVAAAETLAASENAETRANAMEACGTIPERMKTVLRRGLTDSNMGVRTVAAMTIGKRKLKGLSTEVEPLLKDDSGFVRAAAVYALVSGGHGVDQTPLAGLLLRDSSPRVRAHAAFIIGEIGNASALGLLRQASREKMGLSSEAENKALQLQIAEAMVKLGENAQTDSIRAALYGGPEELETTALAAQILGQLGDRGAIAHLSNLAIYKDKAGNPLPPDVRMALATALCKLGESDAGAIALDHVSSENPAYRKQAASVLGASGRQEHLPRLEQLLADADESVQIAAADGILKILEKRR